MMNSIKCYPKTTLSQFLLLAVLFASLSSCIATNKIVYVEENHTSSVTQTYTPQNWEHKIEPGDRFFIQITDPLSNVAIGISGENPTSAGEQQVNIILQSPTIQDYLVNDSGMIDFPLLGNIEVQGKTISELTKHIRVSCKGFIANPSIKLYMTNYNVTVLGEVNNPSFLQMITYKPTFFDAIGLANDLTDFAERKRVKIIRKVEDKVEVAYVDITDPSFITSPYYYLHPNDVIHVMPLKVKKYNRDNALSLLLSSVTTILTIITITNAK